METAQPLTDESAGARKLLRIQSRADSVASIQREVAKHFGLDVSDLLGPCRQKKYATPRHIAIWLCRELVKGENGKPVSFPTLGKLFGGRDHTTILNALRRIQEEVEEGGEMAKVVLGLSNIVRTSGECHE